MNHTDFYRFDILTTVNASKWCSNLEPSLLYRASGNNPALTALAIDFKCKRLACGVANAEDILPDTRRGEPQRVINGHEGIISGLQFIRRTPRAL